jgi:uncharacterized protein (TIGR03083 family)
VSPVDQGQIAADWAALYEGVERRVAEVVTAGDCERPVAACPGWTVHDVVAHLAGLCQDWVEGRDKFGYASDEWTADQVARFADRSCGEILEAWSAATGPFCELREGMSGLPPGRWAFGDGVIHEADLRAALDAGRVPDADVTRQVGMLSGRWSFEVLGPAALPAIEFRAPGAGAWVLGPPAGRPVAARIDVEPYELFRALAGRRSAAQVRAWDWSIDPEPFVAAGLPYPFRWAAEDIVD